MKSWTVPLDIEEPMREDLIPNFRTTRPGPNRRSDSPKVKKSKRKKSKASRRENRK